MNRQLNGENYIMWSFIFYMGHLNHINCCGQDMLHGWEMAKGHIGKPERKHQPGRLKIRNLKEIGYEGDWKNT